MRMTRRQKQNLYRILASLVVFLIVVFAPLPKGVEMIGYFICYLIIGYDILWKAVTNIFAGQVFDENFLMALATVGAMALGDFKEGVAVMLFYQVGELFQSCAVSRSRQSITELMDIRPDYAHVLREGGEETVEPDGVELMEEIVVRPGERVPLDGIVLSGQSCLDTAALTGESMPRDCGPGDEVISGCINQSGVIHVQVTKKYAESTVSKILDLVENATDKKAKTENFITRFAKVYTPLVVIGAVLLAFLPPLLMDGEYGRWIHRALNFLVVSCPCALVISVPLSFFGGIGAASSKGILVKGSNCLEVLAGLDYVVFDKTGTLTKGEFQVSKFEVCNGTKEELLECAAYAEYHSNHPISRAILKAYGKEVVADNISQVEEIAGQGISVQINGRRILAGNKKLMDCYGIECYNGKEKGTVVHVAVEDTYIGAIWIEDVLKTDAKQTISELKKMGVSRTVMLTGDSDYVGQKVADELQMDEVYTKLLPDEKVSHVETLLGEATGALAFVGDGINDAPVLARADLGVAMGGLGSDAAIEAADVVLMTDEPSKLILAVRIAKKTMRIVYENIVFAIGVKILVLILSALGLASMWAAVFADVGVAVIAILNAIRALSIKEKELR